jgi:3-oxoacyl-[acyl-carrier protein] reductase
MTKPLEGRTAVVTGGARGIGRAYALGLANAGADVAVLDLDMHSFKEFEGESALLTADSVVEEVRGIGRRALGFEVDGTDEEGVGSAIREIFKAWQRIDIFVNNAGGGVYSLGNKTTPSNVPLADVRACMERNLITTVVGCQAVIPVMRSGSGGSIVNVASQAAILPMEPMYAHYGAAKAGVVTYSKYLAEEVGPDNIRVNVIAPGYVGTGRLAPIFEAAGSEVIRNGIALRRIGTPEDCADVVTFLASDAAKYVSGQVVSVCGGPYVYGSHRCGH